MGDKKVEGKGDEVGVVEKAVHGAAAALCRLMKGGAALLRRCRDRKGRCIACS